MEMNSSEVLLIPGLQKEEKEAVEKRSLHVARALEKLEIHTDEAPVIALLCSGGGLRAHLACLGVLSEMKEQGLLDAVTYLTGVSGSTWALSSFYAHHGNTEEVEADLKCRFDQKAWDLKQSLERAIRAARLESFSLTDFWAYIIVSKQTRELHDSCLSSLAKHVDEGTLPYPIFAAIDDDLRTAWQKKKALNTWFEFTPHHTGYPALGAYIPTTQLLSLKEKLKGNYLLAGTVEGKDEDAWLSAMAERWDQISEEEQGQFMEYLVRCFARAGPLTFHGDVRDEAMSGQEEFLHLVDAGLAINASYPLVLPPTRKADLILSFDFSAGDPFETIRATADYCHHGAIPFPPVEEKDLQAWSKAPSDCYIFKGETGPVVMHFPLFNTEVCGDDIQKWIDSYGTIKLADSYTQDVVLRLLEVSKKNVRHNKENILREIRNIVREPRKFKGVTEEDVDCPRTVGIEITNNTDVTFKEPLFYCPTGCVQVAPPPVLPPQSTISCSFVKTSPSSPACVGLLVYQGPEVHLALLFSTSPNYAHHSIEFALAALTGPITSDQLGSVFDNILQEKGSQEMKVVKCVLRAPRQTLELESDSLTIRAIASNVPMAKMNVVVQTKAT
ncbi:cytosolic phospholipase A2 gamma [Echinops telfairi]|uniref:Cytosolic phospholipase A2 gamma n=1 Tax=Echinops telfairi TaxID=9371 RepID=A0AC55DA24_ECHTE|nr:cytosolic phospholipase A2 gamma [Echinops telfairi]